MDTCPQSVPNIPSPVGHGWKVENDTILTVFFFFFFFFFFFDGSVSAEVLRELVCSCRGCNICASKCVSGTNSLLKFVLAKAMTNAKMN